MLLPPLTFDVDMYDRPCMVDDSKNSRRISMSKKIRQTTDKKWLQELNLIWEFFFINIMINTFFIRNLMFTWFEV